MHIIHVTSELAKLSKVGGLGDVVYGLCRQLVALGHTVEIILPKYTCMKQEEHLPYLEPLKQKVLCKEGDHLHENTIWKGILDDLPITLIEPHHPGRLFARGAIYGFPDDVQRFAYFSKATLAYLEQTKQKPDICHLHDWPTALIPLLTKNIPGVIQKSEFGKADAQNLGQTLVDPEAGPVQAQDRCREAQKLGCQQSQNRFSNHERYQFKTVLTIHNLEHQGRCAKSNPSLVSFKDNSALQDPKDPSLLNLLKAGIIYADHVTTVSPNYKKEIQTPEGGAGLDALLREHSQKLSGILNGIDAHFWNPEEDPYLVSPYTTHSLTSQDALKTVLAAKEKNKKKLRSLVHLKEDKKPLVAAVTRLSLQKAPLLIVHALRRTLEKGGQFILLGSCPDPSLAEEFSKLQKEFQGNDHVALILEHDELLAHLIFASSDLFMIPSIFEPCGLTQMIALRYGTLPIARLTGGLKDTVFDIDTSSEPLEKRNGFTFDFPDPLGVNWALDRALDCYFNDPAKWNSLLFHGMQSDFGWKKPTEEYLRIYQTLC